MVQWEVTDFQIRTSRNDRHTDILYANSRMQVPVYARIKATVQGTDEAYRLTSYELDSIELVDYTDTDQVLSDGWSYTDQANQFANSLNLSESSVSTAAAAATTTTAPAPASDQDDLDDGYQSKRYWVSTTKIQNKNISARIFQPDGTAVTTDTGDEYSYVTLTGLTPITYTMANIQVDREDTANGTSPVYLFNEYPLDPVDWDQDNYYITTKDYPLQTADISNYDVTGSWNGVIDDAHLANAYGYNPVSNVDVRIFFIWDYGSETTKSAGVDRQDYGFDTQSYADIKINQRPNALCLTRMEFSISDASWWVWGNTEWWYIANITLYDIYGNSGSFHASFEGEYVTISDANPSDSAVATSVRTRKVAGSTDPAPDHEPRIVVKGVEYKGKKE